MPKRLRIIPPSAEEVKPDAWFTAFAAGPAPLISKENTHALMVHTDGVSLQVISLSHHSLVTQDHTSNHFDATNMNNIPKESAAPTYTGTNAKEINSFILKCQNSQSHSCLSKKYINQKRGESIIYIHIQTHLIKSAIKIASIKIQYITTKSISKITFTASHQRVFTHWRFSKVTLFN